MAKKQPIQIDPAALAALLTPEMLERYPEFGNPEDIAAVLDPARKLFSPKAMRQVAATAPFLADMVLTKQWSPQQPTERQKLFLEQNDVREVFYGGAAGGAKSSALLMAALEFVNTPNYSALLLRRTYADLSKPGALMDRANGWLRNTSAKWNEQRKSWTFPSGATLTFGYLDTENDKYQFQGAEFQFIGFDELSQFTESQYLYLFSRLRRLAESELPLRMRSASNPGGVGARWVYKRFIPEGFTPTDALEAKVRWKEGADDTGKQFKRAFIPARLQDNPHLDREQYEEFLNELDPITREQLLRGDWLISERGDILSMWDEKYHVISWREFERVYGQQRIPAHWLLGVYQDVGTTNEHPCVTSWFATAPQNAPHAGSVFLYRGLTVTDWTARAVAEELNRLMRPHNEKERVRRWQMSHEASNERMTYQREHSIPFRNWPTGKTRGIAQLRNALEVIDKDEPHPFRPHLKGHPRLYLVVDHDELLVPTTDAGLVRHRAEIPAYHWNMPKSGEAPATLVPYPLFNDACFVAGTLVTTKRGNVPIEQVSVNDLVLTRHGWKATSGAYCTGVYGVNAYTFSDGSILTCTPNHPIWQGENFVAIDTLRATIAACKISNRVSMRKSLPLMGSTSFAIPYRQGGLSRIILTRSMLTPSAALRRYISRFGSSIRAQFQQAIMSTIEILIRLTTTLATWNALVLRPIGSDMLAVQRPRSSGSTWIGLGRWQANGIGAGKVGNGIAEMVLNHGRSGSGGRFGVSTALKPLSLKTPRLSIVRSAVSRLFAIARKVARKSFDYVSGAAKNLRRVSTPRLHAVPIRVVSVSHVGLRPVFNLKTYEQSEYFANGLLVHNCDTIRAAACDYFPLSKSLTATEKFEQAIPEEYRLSNLLHDSPTSLTGRKTMTAQQQMAYDMQRMLAQRRIKPRRTRYLADDY